MIHFGRVLASLCVVAAAFAGCSLAEALDGAPCNGDDDCLGDYRCVRTPSQGADDPGRCLFDAACVPAVQEGCPIDVDAECEHPLRLTCTDDESLCLCCSGGALSGRFIGAQPDTGAAICVSCPDCSGSDDPCLVGTRNCRPTEGMCGCVTPDDKIVNSLCDDDAACGDGFVCVRTLEEQAEPLDTEAPDVEPGRCRPEADPTCIEAQLGCRTSEDCDSVLANREPRCTAAGDCYCCASEFPTEHIYATAPDGSSAACIACGGCPVGETVCTELEDPNCVVTDGLCGCAP